MELTTPSLNLRAAMDEARTVLLERDEDAGETPKKRATCLVTACERESTKRYGKYCSSSCSKKVGLWKKGSGGAAANVTAHQAPGGCDETAL